MRTSLLALSAILSLLGSAAHSQDQDKPKKEFAVHRVAGNVYMLDSGGLGGNVAVLVGNDGVLLVDAQMEPFHERVLTALRTLSDKPVRYVIDTHCHGDHTWGNASFQKEGATVIAHRSVRARLNTDPNCGPHPGTGLPTLTFDSELTLYFDDEEVRIIKLPPGHTDGDVLVYFKNANVVETGDAFVSKGLPGGVKAQDGSMTGIIEELQKITGLVPADASVIPGHGAQASMGDVRHSLQILQDMREAVERQVRAGKTLDEMKTMNVLSPWKDVLGAPCVPHTPCDHLDSDFYLAGFYSALTTAHASSNLGHGQRPVQ